MKNKISVKGGIGFKLVLVFLLLISVPLATLGTSSYLKSKAALEENMQTDFTEMGNQIKNAINIFVGANEESAKQMGKDPNVQRILDAPTAKDFMFKSFQAFKESHPNVLSIYLGTRNKDMYVYPQSPLPAGFDPTSRPWYQDAFEKKDIVWTDPYADASTGKMIVSVAIPVYNSFNNNDFVGVLGLDISLESFAEMISKTKVGKGGSASFS